MSLLTKIVAALIGQSDVFSQARSYEVTLPVEIAERSAASNEKTSVRKSRHRQRRPLRLNPKRRGRAQPCARLESQSVRNRAYLLVLGVEGVAFVLGAGAEL